MKKRLLSALLALALVFVLLPTTALADTTPVTDENVKINGTAVIVGNGISLGEGNGTYSYDKATHTLTLNSATINATDSNIGISFGVPVKGNIDYKIELVGNNSITSTSAQAIYVEHDTSVEAWENDTMKRSTLTINGSAGSSLILNASGYEKEAIWSKGDFTLSGGTAVTAFSSGKIAVNVGSMTINNSKLSAQSSSYGTTVVLYGFEMIGDAAEFEALNTSSGVRAVLRTSGASENIDWSKYQLITGSYSGNALTKSEPTVCDKNTLNELFSSSSTTRYIHIAKRTIPALQRTSDVLIAGKDAVVGVETSIPSAKGSGTYYYDQASKTLTLNNVTITSGTNAIQFAAAGTYTVKLEGTNKISNVSNGISVTDDKYITSLNVTITGTGSLDISAKGLAINMKKGDLKFENTGEIKLTTSNISPTHNVLSVSGNITIADMEKYKVEGIVQDNTKDGGDTVTLSEASHLKGYQNPDGTAICLKTITITPTPAKDSTISYGKKTLKQGEIIKGEISGTATVATKGNTITLNNFKGTQALSFEATLADSTLVLEGTNTLSSIVTTQKGLTISDSGSLTVGSIRVPNNTQHTANLTINGATVTVGTAELNARAIDVNGSLTVTGASLTATSASDSVPTVQVGGNASFTGSTVTITNNSTTQGKSGKNSYEVSTGLYVGGTLDIKNAAKVTSTVTGGNAIYAKGDITISGDSTEVNAQNSAYKFSAISTNKTVNISDNSTVKAENLKRHQGDPTGETDPSTGKTYNACPAITGKIANKNTQNKLHIAGFTTSSAGSQNPTEGTPLYLDIAPGSVEPYIHHYKVTITRGDEVTRTPSPVDIDGHTLLNDTYYTITNGSTVVANGSESNYNAFYDSVKKTLKLNNAKISTTTNNAAIKIGEDAFATYTITVTGTNELKGNHNHCIESYDNFTINGTGTLNMTNTNSSSRAASVIYCGPYKNLTIAAEVIIKNEAQPGNLIFTVEKDAYSFAKGYNVYASTDVSGSPLETYDAAKSSTYQYLRITKENLAPTTPTTYTVTITAGDNMKCESGALTQEVTKGAAITEVKFVAASGHYFPADYVSKMNLPAGLTAEIRENSWYLIISGTPTSDVTINLPAASVRPTITVSMPTPAAGNTPATANDITLTYSDINKSISKNLTISNVVWQSYVSNGDGSITLGEILSNGDKFVEGTKYRVTINFEGVSEDYAIVPAAGTTAWSNAEWGPRTMTLHFDVTGAACTHEYTNDWHANGNTHWHECKLCRAHADEVAHTFGDWITDTPATDTTDGSKHRTCSVCQYQENATIPKTGTGEIVPPTPDNPGTIVIIRPAEEEKPAQQPNPSTGANDLVGLAVAAAVAAALGSAALLRKHD